MTDPLLINPILYVVVCYCIKDHGFSTCLPSSSSFSSFSSSSSFSSFSSSSSSFGCIDFAICREADTQSLTSTRPPGAERPVVHVDPATGKADGPHRKKLRTYLGIVARDKVDVIYKNWKEAEFDIPEASDCRTKRKLLQTTSRGNEPLQPIRTVSRTLSVRNTASARKSGPSFARLRETLLGRMCARRHRPSRSRILPPTFCPVGVAVSPAKPTPKLDPEVDDPLYLMTLTIPEHFLRPYQVRWDATVFGVFNPDFPLYIKHEDLSEIAHGGQCLNISVLQLWILHLTETCMRAGNSDIYGFLEPQSIERSGQSQFESESYIKSWMQSSQRDVYLGDYLNGGHWQMVVILPKEHLVVWFCSVHNRPDNYLKGIINSALKGLDYAPQPKSKAPARWIVVKYFNDPRPLEAKRLKALRVQWAQFYLRVRDQAYDLGTLSLALVYFGLTFLTFSIKLCLCLVSWLCCCCVVVASSESNINPKDHDQTPTWVVACVCTVFILISITLEKSLHKVGIVEKHKKALLKAFEKVKAELMVFGFLSLLLTFGQSYIVRICIPADVADKFLPCLYVGTHKGSSGEEEHCRKLLSYECRYLSDDATSWFKFQRHQPLLSGNGLHQLHILIFFLAVLHVFYSVVTMLLGRLKIRGWKAWEAETSSHGYEFANDPSRFRLTQETSFVRAHASLWTRYSIFFHIVHLAPGSKFNFQKYIKRSLEDDFKVVVRVRYVDEFTIK
ncbi:MLO-like protein 8 [Glycine max]|nr:MLO-like protein 8 [Glycine max]